MFALGAVLFGSKLRVVLCDPESDVVVAENRFVLPSRQRRAANVSRNHAEKTGADIDVAEEQPGKLGGIFWNIFSDR